MVVPQYYPFDIKKFPEEDDILLSENDLQRKNVIYCRQEILQQMKCTQWARDEYLVANKDPDDHNQWFHHHLQKCYTPYMDAVGCLYNIADKEVRKMKREAGPEGWKRLEADFVADTAKSVGETKAKMMWELSTNLKQIHETTRRRDGHLFGETPRSTKNTKNVGSNNNSQQQQQQPRNMAEAMGLSGTAAAKRSQLEVEDMFSTAKKVELKEQMVEAKKKENASFWKFGSSS